MKTSFFLLCFLTAFAANAQFMGGGMGRQGMGGMSSMNQPVDNYRPSAMAGVPGILAERETKWLRDSLSLSKEQTKAVKKLNGEYAKQQQEAVTDILGNKGAQPTPDQIKQVREAMTMLNDEKQDSLKALLTPEQWKTYADKRLKMWEQTGNFYQKGFNKLN
ncbi:MAG: hypothetical protein EAZ91_18295 [Cytophagales bacterium]|nr:MAG: hypothetical protein EAZ91_18295 [Cytophagales bacterium]